MIHHLPHEVHVRHEHACISLTEEMVDSEEALLEGLPLGVAHGFGQLAHRRAGFRFLGGGLDGFDEKLQRRFLQDYGEVRGLRLG